MKKSVTLLYILTIWIQAGHAQDAGSSIESFRYNVLPSFITCFSAADLTFKGQLRLSALPKYAQFTTMEKKAVMDKLIYNWQESLVMVEYESKRELWGWNSEALKSLLLDSWDINTIPVSQPTSTNIAQTDNHPWFYYVGGMFTLDSFKNINMAFNTSLGFFLLKNRWDLAATFSASILGNVEAEDASSQISSGLQSKVYFPVPKYRISPNIGAEIAWTTSSYAESSAVTFTPAALLGISWHVGGGSLDFGLKINKQPTAMIGYTFIPKLKK